MTVFLSNIKNLIHSTAQIDSQLANVHISQHALLIGPQTSVKGSPSLSGKPNPVPTQTQLCFSGDLYDIMATWSTWLLCESCWRGRGDYSGSQLTWESRLLLPFHVNVTWRFFSFSGEELGPKIFLLLSQYPQHFFCFLVSCCSAWHVRS